MSTETTVQNLKINKLTKAQFDTITPSATEAYELTDLSNILDSKLQNTATGSNALTIGGYASTTNSGTNLGINSRASATAATALGNTSTASGSYSTAIGRNATASDSSAIQIGFGTNSTANTLNVGFYNNSTTHYAWQLLDGTTGKMPSDRIKYDGTTITVNANGELTSTGGGGSSSSRNIGEIVSSTIPLTDAGLHLLDGALLSGSGSYSAFVDYIADLYDSGDYSAIFDTEANWQAAVTANGVCGKFVYDSVNNTVRLPKYNSKIYTGGGNAPVKGNGNTLGFTTGNDTAGLLQGGDDYNFSKDYYDRALPYKTTTTVASANRLPLGQAVGVTTDGTKSGIIADLSNITTSLDGYYYIVVATTTKTDIEVDIDEIATDLNGKADTDLSNVPNSKGILTESYVNGTSWYRVYSDGWCEQGGEVASGSGTKTAALLKEFANTDYFVSVTLLRSTNGGAYAPTIVKSTTEISIMQDSSTTLTGSSKAWYACGYIN